MPRVRPQRGLERLAANMERRNFLVNMGVAFLVLTAFMGYVAYQDISSWNHKAECLVNTNCSVINCVNRTRIIEQRPGSGEKIYLEDDYLLNITFMLNGRPQNFVISSYFNNPSYRFEKCPSIIECWYYDFSQYYVSYYDRGIGRRSHDILGKDH